MSKYDQSKKIYSRGSHYLAMLLVKPKYRVRRPADVKYLEQSSKNRKEYYIGVEKWKSIIPVNLLE